MLRLIHVAAVLLSLALLCRAGCFYMDGNEDVSGDYQPCSNSTSDPLSKICCKSSDSCIDNGLCMNNVDKVYWRESCTQENWAYGGCQDLCTSEQTQMSNDTRVTPCDGTSGSTIWCCGDTDDCCKDGSDLPQYTIASILGSPIPTPTSSSSSSYSSVSGTTATNSITSPAVLTSNTSNVLSTGAKAGIGVGAAVGAIALIALGIFFAKAWQWKKEAQQIRDLNLPVHKEIKSPYESQVGFTPDDVYQQQAIWPPELNSSQSPQLMASEQETQELAASEAAVKRQELDP